MPFNLDSGLSFLRSLQQPSYWMIYEKNVDEGKLVGAAFIDLREAFDTISHLNLLDNLPQYGIRD